MNPMHPCRQACVLAALFSLTLVTSAFAADGTALSGSVTDANSRAALPGVEVRLPANGVTTATEADGSFHLGPLSPGTYQITFRYLGYEPVTRTVTLGATANPPLLVTMGADVVRLTAFHVEGAREGQARALNQQKTAGNIRDIVAADAIGNFPDKNVAEALQRVTGVSTVTLRGEANYITIRGANPAWNSVTLDGMSLLAANAAHSDQLGHDMRSVPLDVFSSAQVGRMEVVKALTPDLDGDSIGGAVLLKSRSAFDVNRRVITGSVAGTYNDLAAKPGYRAVMSYSDLFGPRRDWGLQLSLTREKKQELEESNETNDWFPIAATVNGSAVKGFVPTTALQTFVDDERLRDSASGSIEKKFGDTARLYVRGFANRFKETDERYGTRFMPGLTDTGGGLDATQPVRVGATGTWTTFTASKATTRRLLQPQLFDDRSSGLTAGGSWQAADWELEASAGYSRATEWFVTDQGQWNSASSANRATFDYTANNFWRVSQLSGTGFLDPAGFKFNSAKHREDSSGADEYDGKIDAKHDLSIAGTPVHLRTGWKSRWNTKHDDNNVANYKGVTGTPLAFNDARLGGVIDPDTGFLDGRYDMGPFPAAGAWSGFFNANRAPLDNATGTFPNPSGIFTTNANSEGATLSNDYRIQEDIHAGYLRADWNIGPVSVIAGARYERTDLKMRAVKVDDTKPATDPSAYSPYRRNSSYDNWLPSVHLRYAVKDNFILRAAWSNSLARPDAASMVPSLEVDPANLTLTGGNPNLHAVSSENWDVSAEYYLSSVGIVSIAAFSKSIDGPIYPSATFVTYDAGDGPQRYTFNTSLNAGRARLRGIELTYQQQLRFLPSPFDGLGIYSNYTVTDSHVDVPSRPGESFTLFNQSKWVGNAAIFYQKYNLSARLAYSFRAPYLSVLLLPGTDTYYDLDHRLDFQIGYKFGGHWTLQLAANNLENTPERQYHGDPSRQEFYGLTGRFYSLGVAWEF
ncbi:MAG TPA: TonB-dependent receptor [Opitutaceae bacterium]|nr:TonB-dependent receptor [Opitutaceae bacterium]